MTDKDGSTAPPLKAAWTADDDHTIDHFRNLVDRFGVDTQALGWRDSRSQTARFEVLASGGLDPEASLLDIGCGQGDLFAWLRENEYCVDYCGVDLTPEMVSIARARFPEARFEVADLFDLDASYRAHHVIASGIFSTRQAAPFDYLQAAVTHLFRFAEVSLAFNCLSTHAEHQDEGEYREDPAKVLRFCFTLTPFATLRHDYHRGDFTVFLRREARRA